MFLVDIIAAAGLMICLAISVVFFSAGRRTGHGQFLALGVWALVIASFQAAFLASAFFQSVPSLYEHAWAAAAACAGPLLAVLPLAIKKVVGK